MAVIVGIYTRTEQYIFMAYRWVCKRMFNRIKNIKL